MDALQEQDVPYGDDWGSAANVAVWTEGADFQTRKYRSTDKFTGGLNRKLLKIDEYAVRLPDQRETAKRGVSQRLQPTASRRG